MLGLWVCCETLEVLPYTGAPVCWVYSGRNIVILSHLEVAAAGGRGKYWNIPPSPLVVLLPMLCFFTCAPPYDVFLPMLFYVILFPILCSSLCYVMLCSSPCCVPSVLLPTSLLLSTSEEVVPQPGPPWFTISIPGIDLAPVHSCHALSTPENPSSLLVLTTSPHPAPALPRYPPHIPQSNPATPQPRPFLPPPGHTSGQAGPHPSPATPQPGLTPARPHPSLPV